MEWLSVLTTSVREVGIQATVIFLLFLLLIMVFRALIRSWSASFDHRDSYEGFLQKKIAQLEEDLRVARGEADRLSREAFLLRQDLNLSQTRVRRLEEMLTMERRGDPDTE